MQIKQNYMVTDTDLFTKKNQVIMKLMMNMKKMKNLDGKDI